MNQPKRGEVWIVNIGLSAKVRPCLILSVSIEITDRALVTVVPHTTSTRYSRFEVKVTAPFFKSGVFDAQNIITIPLSKLERKVWFLNVEQIRVIEDAVKKWLGF